MKTGKKYHYKQTQSGLYMYYAKYVLYMVIYLVFIIYLINVSINVSCFINENVYNLLTSSSHIYNMVFVSLWLGVFDRLSPN